jgi:hypothetical protein
MVVLSAALARSEEHGFQLALTPEVAIHPTADVIRGVSIGVWSENPQHALALGFANGSTGTSSGLSLAWALNYAESYNGVQFAFVNVVRKEFNGVQFGAVNISRESCAGVQAGWVNMAVDFSGLQLGFVNYTEKLQGMQIGFANFALDNTWFREFPGSLAVAFPIVNWSF